MRRSLVVMLFAALVLGCSKHATAPRNIAPVPHGLVAAPYSSPVWLPGDSLIGFNHTQLDSIEIDPQTGEVQYTWLDSTSGWWVIDRSGTLMRKRFDLLIGEPAVRPQGDIMACTLPDTRLYLIPMVAGMPELLGMQLTQAPASVGMPSWTSGGDSLLFYSGWYSPPGTWIGGPDGGGARKLRNWFAWASGVPGRRQIVGAANDSAGSTILRLDQDTGQTEVILRDTAGDCWNPRYSYDRRFLAYVRMPNTPRDAPTLLVIDSTGGIVRQVVGVGVDFAWEREGVMIAYVRDARRDYSKQNGVLMLLDVQSGTTRQLTVNP